MRSSTFCRKFKFFDKIRWGEQLKHFQKNHLFWTLSSFFFYHPHLLLCNFDFLSSTMSVSQPRSAPASTSNVVGGTPAKPPSTRGGPRFSPKYSFHCVFDWIFRMFTDWIIGFFWDWPILNWQKSLPWPSSTDFGCFHLFSNLTSRAFNQNTSRKRILYISNFWFSELNHELSVLLNI